MWANNKGEVIQMDIKDLPAGFSMALSRNHDALARFGKMSEEEQQKVVEHARSVTSKQEMQVLVYDLSKN